MARARTGSGVSDEYLRKVGILPPKAAKKSGIASACRGLAALPSGVVVLRAVLPGEGVSVNRAYFNVPGQGRVATPELRAWKIACATNLLVAEHAQSAPSQRYRLDLALHRNWEDDDGMPYKADSSNLVKTTEDILCKFLGVDDCWIYEHRILKVQDRVWSRQVVTLTTL